MGNKFSRQLIATGGSGKGYTFTTSDLPTWLNLSTTGLLSGTPTTNGGTPMEFTVTVADSNGAVGTKSYNLTVDPTLAINPATLGVATVGDKFSRQLTATGGSGKGYTFTATGLPSWLKITSAGLLSGTPAKAIGALLNITVKVSDSLKATGNTSYALTIDPALAISPSTLPVATVANPFSVQLTAEGGAGAGYSFTATGLPFWLTITSAGLLSGTPTTAAGSPLHFTINVSDSNAGATNHGYALTIDPALAVGPATLTVATVGDKFSTQLTATGGSGAGYTFTATGLPSWLTLTSAGLLSGTPATVVAAPLNITVTVSDSLKATGSTSFALTIDPALAISPSGDPGA